MPDNDNWRFDPEDEIQEIDNGIKVEHVGKIFGQTVYTVKRRLIDPDSDRRFYQVEWDEETGDDRMGDINKRTTLKSASMVENQYNIVGEE